MNIPETERSPLAGLWSRRIAFVIEQRPTHALTVAYNESSSLPRVRGDLRRLHARIDRALLGRRFNTQPAACRTWFAAFIERLTTNTHAHLVLRAPPGREAQLEALFAESRSPWARITQRATHALRPLTDAAGWAAYATKEMTSRSDWYLSDEFLPVPAGGR
jgi:hypothetical protein